MTFCLLYFLSKKDPVEHIFSSIWTLLVKLELEHQDTYGKTYFAQFIGFLSHRKNCCSSEYFIISVYYYEQENRLEFWMMVQEQKCMCMIAIKGQRHCAVMQMTKYHLVASPCSMWSIVNCHQHVFIRAEQTGFVCWRNSLYNSSMGSYVLCLMYTYRPKNQNFMNRIGKNLSFFIVEKDYSDVCENSRYWCLK